MRASFDKGRIERLGIKAGIVLDRERLLLSAITNIYLPSNRKTEETYQMADATTPATPAADAAPLPNCWMEIGIGREAGFRERVQSLTPGEKVGKLEFKLYDDVVPKVGSLGGTNGDNY